MSKFFTLVGFVTCVSIIVTSFVMFAVFVNGRASAFTDVSKQSEALRVVFETTDAELRTMLNDALEDDFLSIKEWRAISKRCCKLQIQEQKKQSQELKNIEDELEEMIK